MNVYGNTKNLNQTKFGVSGSTRKFKIVYIELGYDFFRPCNYRSVRSSVKCSERSKPQCMISIQSHVKLTSFTEKNE